MNSLSIVSYDAPSVEFATVKAAGSHKRKGGDDGAGAAVTGRVLCCIKAKPWGLELGCEGADLRKAKVSCQLLLCDTDEPVEARTVEPLHFSVRPAKDGRTATVEVRIAVLSSQLEGALFKLRFGLGEGNDGEDEEEEGLWCDSDPIKVVSKKSQLEKGDKPVKRTRTTQVATRDAVLDMIQKMEEQQAATAGMLGRMAQQMETLSAKVAARDMWGTGESVEDSETASSLSPSQGVVRLRQALAVFGALDAAGRQQMASSLRSALSPAEAALHNEIAAEVCHFAPPPPMDFRASLTNVNMGGLFDL